MSELQLQQFLAKEEKERYWALWALMADCGLRIAEALKLRWRDVREGGGTGAIVKVEGKGDRIRYVEMTARVRNAMTRVYVEGTAGEKKLFPFTARAAQLRMKKTLSLANLKTYWSPHTLRHSFATRLIENGTPLHEVKSIMGHQSIKTTEKYLHVATGALGRARGTLERAAGTVEAIDSQKDLKL